jgi:tRNA (adenine57-N1/adenine58-N1)-methyltransferase
MDFARPLKIHESIASKSKIRYISLRQTSGDASNREPRSLDEMQLQAANEAARDMILGPHISGDDSKLDVSKIDASFFTERLLPDQHEIRTGDLVVIMESFDNLAFVYAKEGEIFSNRNGNFHHNDFIGKPFGCKIRSRSHRGYGFVYLLKPTPELWARSLNHRTQIVHELDQSQVIFQLHLKPNMTVVESGTGSGAMSHAILRTIAPHGKLHTYEFNEHRADTARHEFANNGVGHLVSVHHKDVCGIRGDGGFDLPPQSVDGVFLDLPEPWLAVPHAAFVMKPNARLASYSPCVEQTQRMVETLRQSGFHSIKTMEYRLQEHYVDEFEGESPPKEKRLRVCIEPHHVAHIAKKQERTEVRECDDEKDSDSHGLEKERESEAGIELSRKKVGQDFADSSTRTSAAASLDVTQKKMIVARPFVMMRGHTAFLTFCSAGNVTKPNPIINSKNLI